MVFTPRMPLWRCVILLLQSEVSAQQIWSYLFCIICVALMLSLSKTSTLLQLCFVRLRPWPHWEIGSNGKLTCNKCTRFEIYYSWSTRKEEATKLFTCRFTSLVLCFDSLYCCVFIVLTCALHRRKKSSIGPCIREDEWEGEEKDGDHGDDDDVLLFLLACYLCALLYACVGKDWCTIRSLLRTCNSCANCSLSIVRLASKFSSC